MENLTQQAIDNFVRSYIATAIWVTFDSGAKAEATKQAYKVAEADCIKFIQAIYAEFTPSEAEAIVCQNGSDLTSLAGHDFFLTRNGHGAGFWDKDIYNTLAENGGDRLTKLANQAGEAYCYRIKGGWVYFE
jgi:hypothetical protein